MAVRSGALIRVVISLVLIGLLVYAFAFELLAQQAQSKLDIAINVEGTVGTQQEVRELVGRDPDESYAKGSYIIDEFTFRSGIPGRKFKYFVLYPLEAPKDATDGSEDRPISFGYIDKLHPHILSPPQAATGNEKLEDSPTSLDGGINEMETEAARAGPGGAGGPGGGGHDH